VVYVSNFVRNSTSPLYDETSVSPFGRAQGASNVVERRANEVSRGANTNKMNKATKFLKEVQTELKKVTWPTQEQSLRLTAIVVGVSLFVGLYIGVLDYALTKIIEVVVK